MESLAADSGASSDAGSATSSDAAGKPRKVRKRGFSLLLRRLAQIMVTCYCGFVVILVCLEHGMVFPAPPPDYGNWDASRFGAEETWIASSDDAKVHAWILRHPKPRGVLIYGHGNAETLGILGPELQAMREQWHVTVVGYDYRGYGKTGGVSNEANILADARAVGAWARDNPAFAKLPIIALGRSLGGASAVEMAANGSLDGLILDRTFSSAVDVAAARYFLVPVRWLMRNPLKSIDKIVRYHGPLLQMHGDVDEVIPYRFGKRLFDASPSEPKEWITIPKLYHNDPLPDRYWPKVGEFIGTVQRKS